VPVIATTTSSAASSSMRASAAIAVASGVVGSPIETGLATGSHDL